MIEKLEKITEALGMIFLFVFVLLANIFLALGVYALVQRFIFP